MVCVEPWPCLSPGTPLTAAVTDTEYESSQRPETQFAVTV